MGRGHEILRLAPLLVVFGAALAGCDTDDPIDDSGRPLAWVSGQKLTSADLRFTGPLEEPDQRREVIDRGVDDLLVAREARRRGLGYTEQAVKQIAAVRRAAEIRERRILRDVLYEVVASEVEISEAELREESDRFEGFHQRRLVTLRSQTFRSRALAEQALHTPVTASKIVGPLLVRELPAVLRKATKRLNAIGERVVVPTGEMWSSVELIAEEILAPPTFERARDALQQRLHRRKAAEAFERELERLRAAADIQLEPGVLDNDTLWLPGASSEDSAPSAQPY